MCLKGFCLNYGKAQVPSVPRQSTGNGDFMIRSGKTSTLKEFFAKCLWTIPYFIERIYVKQLANNSNKDEKYISRKNNN